MWSRRELLTSVLGAPFAARLLAGCDEDEPVAPHVEGEILGPSMEAGHRLREGDLPSEAEWAGARTRRVGTVIVGAGPAGLSAAWRLARHGDGDFELLELEPGPGGTSRAGESDVTRYPWGAHYVPVPMAHNRDLIALLDEMGALEGTDERGHPRGAEHVVVRQPEERVFFEGFWYEGLFPYAGASAEELAELRKLRSIVDRYVAMRDGDGRRAFAIPVAAGSDDAEITALDRISAAAWMRREGLSTPRVRWWLEYACRDDYGLGLEETSAWALVWYFAARTPEPGASTMDLLAWPAGNGAIVRHLARAAGDRVRSRRLVADVRPVEDGVEVRAVDLDGGTLEVVQARRAIVAVPRFVAQRVVAPLRGGGDEGFRYGAWTVANLHLRERPGGRGYPLCWDNVLYDSPSLGYVCATHQRGREFGPTVWTWYMAATDADPARGRERLLEPDWDGWREVVVRDLRRAHPDLERHLERLDVWLWGHGMVQPRVGFAWSPERRRASEPRGPIHFAHTDLSGVALFEEAFFHGVRAADEILAAREDGGAVPAGEDAPADADVGGEEVPT